VREARGQADKEDAGHGGGAELERAIPGDGDGEEVSSAHEACADGGGRGADEEDVEPEDDKGWDEVGHAMTADEPCGEAEDGCEQDADVEAGDGEEVSEAGVAEGGVGLGGDAATNSEGECAGDGGLRLRDVTLDGVCELSPRAVDASEGAGAG